MQLIKKNSSRTGRSAAMESEKVIAALEKTALALSTILTDAKTSFKGTHLL